MPNNWKTYKLSEALKIIGGGTPKTSVNEYWNGDIPWLSVKDFQGEKKFVNNTEKSITQLGLEKSSTKLLPKGALIISARGTVGELAVLERDMAFNQSCYGLLPNDKTDRDFLYYLVKQKISDLQGLSYGSVFDTITTKTFDSLNVKIPYLKEQKAIANILSAIDDKIENNLAINKTLEDMAMALYKHWFVDFGPFQDGEFIDSELGPIPKGWVVKRLPEISINHNKKRKPISTRERAKIQGIYPYYGATKVLDYIDDFRFDGEYILLAEDGTVKTERDTPFLQFVNGQFWVSNHAHVLTGNELYSNEFVYLSLSHTNVVPIITGAVQLKINKKNLESLEFIVPVKEQLKEFEDIIIPKFQQIKELEKENQSLTQLRDTLLPKLISGELRLKEFKRQLEQIV
ncbi:restriction endonuclease subunit S [Winogradskyella aquimaris]|uniref:Restriction endonuclease subunit S n=1 Tax=Winogradskyella aquimaris TaxID=864074 RepID=A0ABU5EQ31_9FLAO|nr:restriction endonuclease subunit S [Winogradskyella aquimaris]MDY2586787.1 restriction endonuclease subunit S [Winogradskyella aquimaris]